MDIQSKLQELKQMHENGLLTTSVYEEQQKKLLANGDSDRLLPNDPMSVRTFKSRGWSLASKLVAAVVVVLGGIWLAYQLADRQGKDAISQFASQTGIGKQVIPWTDRAETAARKLVERNSQQIAAAIQGITHPTGKEPKFSRLNVSKLNDRILVEMSVDWKGGLVGANYATTVAWEINERNHIQVKVIADSALTEVASKNKEVLDDYFRTKVYPAFYQDVSGGS